MKDARYVCFKMSLLMTYKLLTDAFIAFPRNHYNSCHLSFNTKPFQCRKNYKVTNFHSFEIIFVSYQSVIIKHYLIFWDIILF